MQVNFLIILVAALVPLIVGFIWYNPKVLGTAWMSAAGMTEDKMKGVNMPLMLGLTYLLSFFLCFALQFMVIHQWHFFSILMNEEGLKDPNSELSMMVKGFMDKYGNNFRTFKHGALHGTIGAITLVLPVVGINALFERRGAKYIFIHLGYWAICFALMGGILCQFS
jgi:Protein of unknown function (DUF1761)